MVNKYPTTSKTLLDKISLGDEISWQDFYARYSPVVLEVAEYKGLNPAEAEDVLQQVMLAFFQQRKTFRFDPDIAKFRTYFGKIVSAKIADVYRAKKEVLCGDWEKTMDERESVSDLDARFLEEYRKAVWNDVNRQLKERVTTETWQTFDLYVLQKRPAEKVAAYFGCSVNRIYQAKKRCLTILREIVFDINRRDPNLKLEMLGD